MQDTRANMGAHLKWDIPMFLGIASTKDSRLQHYDRAVTNGNVLRRSFDVSRSSERARSPTTANEPKKASLNFWESVLTVRSELSRHFPIVREIGSESYRRLNSDNSFSVPRLTEMKR